MWYRKYSPLTLSEALLEPVVDGFVAGFKNMETMPNIFIYGPRSVGKLTLVRVMLWEKLGEDINQGSVVEHTIKYKSKHYNVETMITKTIIVIDCDQIKSFDHYIVQQLISRLTSNAVMSFEYPTIGYIVFRHFGALSQVCQSALRATMEKKIKYFRFILISKTFNGAIEPIRSRCFAIRLSIPSKERLTRILNRIVEAEGLQISEKVTNSIMIHSHREIQKSIIHLQTLLQYGLDPSSSLCQSDVIVNKLIDDCIKDKTPKCINRNRERIYSLQCLGYSNEEILIKIMKRATTMCKETMVDKIITETATCEHMIVTGQEAIYHFEVYIIMLMKLLS